MKTPQEAHLMVSILTAHERGNISLKRMVTRMECQWIFHFFSIREYENSCIFHFFCCCRECASHSPSLENSVNRILKLWTQAQRLMLSMSTMNTPFYVFYRIDVLREHVSMCHLTYNFTHVPCIPHIFLHRVCQLHKIMFLCISYFSEFSARDCFFAPRAGLALE